MAISLAPNFTQRPCYWSAWKSLFTSKNGVHQYEEDIESYTIWFYDTPEVILCTIWKGEVPYGVISSGYTQEQNDSDKEDFEDNFKATANKNPVQKRATDGTPVFYVSSGDSASNVLNKFAEQASGTDKADMRVNGSSTSVDFSFPADSSKDLVVNDICFVMVASSIVSGASKFAGLSKLTNGILVVHSVDSVETTIGVIQENEDFMHFSSVGGYSFWAINKDQVIAHYLTNGGIILNRNSSDKIIVRVRDNLSSGVDYLKCFVKAVKRG